MNETLPRWGLPEVNFIETDPATIEAKIINGYEAASGRTLAAGDPVRLFLLSIAAVIIQQIIDINLASQQNLLTYAQGEYLDALGELLSVERLAESPAVTTIKFTLSQTLGNVYTIPAGTEVTNGMVIFATVEDLNIPIGELSGSVTAYCTTAGPGGNDYLAGQINTIVRPMTFVENAENTTITTGGSEAETDEKLADRIRIAPNGFSVAGPRKAYIYHTKSVSSAIVDVSVTTPTPGEVDVYALLAGGVMPSEETLTQIYDYLSDETIRPLTDYLKVMAPTAVEYELNLHYWINRDDSARAGQIKASVEAAVEKYRVWQQAKIGRDISPDKLIQLVISAGASRIDKETMTPGTFKELKDHEVAQCTGVNIVYEGYKDE